MTSDPWPRLRVDDWAATRDTLHMWTQIVGKTRMAQSPLVNHWWNSTLYVTARGLTTGSMPARSGLVDVELNLLEHRLEAVQFRCPRWFRAGGAVGGALL